LEENHEKSLRFVYTNCETALEGRRHRPPISEW
jgi:hypothetical protein